MGCSAAVPVYPVNYRDPAAITQWLFLTLTVENPYPVLLDVYPVGATQHLQLSQEGSDWVVQGRLPSTHFSLRSQPVMLTVVQLNNM